MRDGGGLTSVGAVTSRGVTVCIVLALGATGCSDDGGSSSPPTTTEANGTTTSTASTAPERPTSTTTTAFDPESVEGAVEAAYLRSWDVYADAVYNLDLDESALADVYAEQGLANVIEEISGRVDEGRAALVQVDHSYQIALTNDDLASVIDELTNHQVLIDPETKEPLEADPDEVQLLNFVMKRIDGGWRVTLIQRVDQ